MPISSAVTSAPVFQRIKEHQRLLESFTPALLQNNQRDCDHCHTANTADCFQNVKDRMISQGRKEMPSQITYDPDTRRMPPRKVLAETREQRKQHDLPSTKPVPSFLVHNSCFLLSWTKKLSQVHPTTDIVT